MSEHDRADGVDGADGVDRADRADRAIPEVPNRERLGQLDRERFTMLWQSAAIGAVTLALALACVGAVWLLLRPLLLVVAAVVLAQALAPIVAWLERWLPRAVGAVLVYLLVLLAAGGLVWLAIPMLVDQASQLLENAPDLIGRLQAWVARRDPLAGMPVNEDQVTDAIRSTVNQFASFLASLPLKIISAAVEIVVVVVMSIYWLLTAPALGRFVLSFVPLEHRGKAAAVLSEMGQTMGNFVRATLIDALIVAVIVYAGLSIIGVDYALTLALVAGLGEFAPVVGPILAAVPALAIALLDSPGQALIVLIFYLALQQLEGNVLLPLIVRQQAHIPPLLTLVALLVGGTLAGILGAILAIPLAGGLRVFVVRVVTPAGRHLTGADREDSDVSRLAQDS